MDDSHLLPLQQMTQASYVSKDVMVHRCTVQEGWCCSIKLIAIDTTFAMNTYKRKRGDTCAAKDIQKQRFRSAAIE